MNEGLLDKLLSQLQMAVPDVFFVQIGAMNGKFADPIFNHVRANRWKGILVEPIPWHFQALKENYANTPNLIFENVAITEEPGKRKISTVSPEALKAGVMPEWAQGISSFLPHTNALGGAGCNEEEFKKIKPHIIEVEVECTTLPLLLQKHNVQKVDLLQLDTEGYDFKILQQFDFTKFTPYVINLEFTSLPQEDLLQCVLLLEMAGYNVLGNGESDMIATVWSQYMDI